MVESLLDALRGVWIVRRRCVRATHRIAPFLFLLFQQSTSAAVSFPLERPHGALFSCPSLGPPHLYKNVAIATVAAAADTGRARHRRELFRNLEDQYFVAVADHLARYLISKVRMLVCVERTTDVVWWVHYRRTASDVWPQTHARELHDKNAAPRRR